MKKILLEDALILNTARAARFLVRFLPLRFSLGIGRALGTLVYFFTKRRKVAYKNLRAAFANEKSSSQMRRIARRCLQNLAMSGIEMLRFPELDKVAIEKTIRFVGLEKFRATTERGQGIIFLTAHFGNWELLNVAGSLMGFPMAVLARVQKHPRSDEFLNSLRTSKGGQVIRKGMPIREILKSLKSGKIVGMLSDQDGGRNGVFTRFFGRLSSSPSGVATFALRTGVPIFPVFIFRESQTRHRVEVEGPLRVPDPLLSAEESERMILQQFMEILEAKIRKSPEQWLWAHRRWKSTPDRSVLILSDAKSGHLNQSRAVLEALKEQRKSRNGASDHVKAHEIEIRYKNEFSKAVLTAFCFLTQGRFLFHQSWLKTCLTAECYEKIMKTYTDAVISCGNSLLAVNLLVAKENGAKSIAVMKPYFSPKRFDAVIVPSHDHMKQAPNIFVTDQALSLMTAAALENGARELSQELCLPMGTRRLGLLVGGDTDTVKFEPVLFQRLLTELKRYSLESKIQVLATSSRRTPQWADKLLKETFLGDERCPLLVIANEANRDGVVAGILGLSDWLVVSGESMSMVSEAVASGKPVIVFIPSDQAKLKTKHRQFLEEMQKENRISVSSCDNISEAIQAYDANMNGNRCADGGRHDRDVLLRAAQKVNL